MSEVLFGRVLKVARQLRLLRLLLPSYALIPLKPQFRQDIPNRPNIPLVNMNSVVFLIIFVQLEARLTFRSYSNIKVGVMSRFNFQEFSHLKWVRICMNTYIGIFVEGAVLLGQKPNLIMLQRVPNTLQVIKMTSRYCRKQTHK